MKPWRWFHSTFAVLFAKAMCSLTEREALAGAGFTMQSWQETSGSVRPHTHPNRTVNTHTQDMQISGKHTHTQTHHAVHARTQTNKPWRPAVNREHAGSSTAWAATHETFKKPAKLITQTFGESSNSAYRVSASHSVFSLTQNTLCHTDCF